MLGPKPEWSLREYVVYPYLHFIHCDGVIAVLFHKTLGEFFERFYDVIAPPLAQVSAHVKLTSLVVEAVRDLMADDDAYPAVVQIPACRVRKDTGSQSVVVCVS